MERGACLAVEKAQPEDVAVEEVGECAKAWREARIDDLLQPALRCRLVSGSEAGDRIVRHEAVLEVQQIHRLATGVLVVLVRPPGERVQVVVDQLADEVDTIFVISLRLDAQRHAAKPQDCHPSALLAPPAPDDRVDVKIFPSIFPLGIEIDIVAIGRWVRFVKLNTCR